MATCKEVKHCLVGSEVTYDCQLVALGRSSGALNYELDRQVQVGSLTLRPGTISYGLYWEDRPYVLYVWFGSKGEPVGYYFNLADSVGLSTAQFAWRDLAVDILVSPCGEVEVLDENEVPLSLDTELKGYIESAKELVLEKHQAIIQEADQILAGYAGKRPKEADGRKKQSER